jgi:RNA recognition motif-containing protein
MFVRENLDNQHFPGWEKPIKVRYNVGSKGPVGFAAGAVTKAQSRAAPYPGGAAAAEPAEAEPVKADSEEQDTVVVTGLPFALGLTDELLMDLFENYGLVTQCKVMPPVLGSTTSSALVQYFDLEDAANLVKSLNGFIPEGCQEPLFCDILRPKPRSGPFAMFSKKLKPVGDWYNADDYKEKHPLSADELVVHLRSNLPGHEAPPGGTLKIQGLPSDCDDVHLLRLFASFGAVSPHGVKVEKDADGRCTGVGVVNYLSLDSVKMAEMILNGISLPHGGTLKVARAEPGST